MLQETTLLKTNSRQLWLLITLLTLLTLISIFGPTAVAQEVAERQLTIVAPALNVRTGPAVTYPATNYLVQGEQVTVLSYDAVNDWWQVQLADGTSGWISGGPAYVSVIDHSLQSLTDDPSQLIDPLPITLPAEETLIFQTATGGPIYAINPDGSNLRYLTTGLDPILSPDGQQVAFTRWSTSQGGALGNLWLINLDGSNERLILNDIHQPRSPVWSPDGSQITITMQHGGRPQAERTCGNQNPGRGADIVSVEKDGRRVVKYCYTLPLDPHWALRVVDVATSQFKDLPHDTYSLSPTWDPLNSWHVVYDGNQGLVNLDINQGTTWPLTTDINDHSPIFSPAGTKIATTYRQHDHWEIHVMNSDGSGRVRLTQTPWSVIVQQDLAGQAPQSWNNAAPTWSPDGAQIAFLTDRSGLWEIWVMNADGSNPRPLFLTEALNGINLQYNGMDERVLSWR